MEDELLKTDEVAKMLNVCRISVYNYVHKKNLQAIRISKRCLRFKKQDVLKWIEQQSQKDTNEKVNQNYDLQMKT